MPMDAKNRGPGATTGLFPTGVFAKSPRVWDINNLTYASLSDQGQASPPYYYLNNNSSRGYTLALYSILGYVGYSVPLMTLRAQYGLDTSGNAAIVTQNLDVTAPKHDGYLSFRAFGGSGGNTQGIIWWADGKRWLRNGDAPLLLIRPGYAAVVSTASLANLQVTTVPTAVTFLWGYA